MPELVWALGCIRYAPALGCLLDYLQSEDEPVRSAAALALLRMGEPRAVDYCLGQAQSNTWPIMPLGLAGGRDSLALLTELAKKSDGGECLTALGLLGDPSSLPLLMSRLEEAPAATALHCLTGAGLYETVFVPEEVDEDELFESEKEQLKQGKPLTRGDGRPFGTTVTRISQKPEDWDRWWRENGNRFSPSMRYRNGGPLSPSRLVDMLSTPSTPHELRRYCSEELAVRYGQDFALEMDTPVVRQVGLLSEMISWSKSSATQFREGAWYFAGYQRD